METECCKTCLNMVQLYSRRYNARAATCRVIGCASQPINKMVASSLAAALCAGLVLRSPPQQRHAPPRCQFKLPDFFQQPEEAESPSPPPAPKEAKNPFASFVEAFTPVEVDRDGNVVPPPPPPAPPPPIPPGEEPDVGEKLFNFFFGAPQEGEVAGLARTAGAPDTYPATKTEFAEPLAGDGAEEALIRPLLKNTNLEFLQLRKAYDASRDGWNAAAFHKGTDLTGPCVIVANTKGGALCGGYAPKGYAGYGEYRGSIAAFLFTWPDGDTRRPAVKLQKIGGAGLATIDEPETGPRFGSDGFVCMMNPGAERRASSKLGPYYEAMPGGGRMRAPPLEPARRDYTTNCSHPR